MKQDTEADTTPIFSSKEGFTYIMNLMRRGKHKELYILFKDVTIPLNLSLEIMKRFLSDGRMIRLCKDPFVVNGHEKHISMVTQACYMTMFYLLSEEGNDSTVEDTGYNDDFFRERGKYDKYPLYYRAANWIPSYSPLIDIVMYQMAFIESLLASKDIPDRNRKLLFEVIGILSGFKDQHYEEVREGGKKCSPLHEKRIRGRDYLEAMGLKLFADGWSFPPMVDPDVIFFPFLRWHHHLDLCQKLNIDDQGWLDTICNFYSEKDIEAYL